MTFLLDTNVVSELRKRQPDMAVSEWSKAVASTQIFVSAVTVLEIEYGILLVARRDARQAAALRAWMTGQFLLQFEARMSRSTGRRRCSARRCTFRTATA